MEGFGFGFRRFLDEIELKVKIDKASYKRPTKDYDFNNDEMEVAIDEADLVR